MQHLDEGTIHAWLDGELPPAEAEAAEAHMATCDECKAGVAEARGFIAASSRILLALDAVPGGVLPESASTAFAKTRAPRRFAIPRAWLAAAAVLVLSTVTVIAVRPRRESTIARVASRDELKSAPMVAAAPEPMAAPAEQATANAPAPKPAGGAAGKLDERADKRTDKSAAPSEAENMMALRKKVDSQPMVVADAPQPAPPRAPASAAPAMRAAAQSDAGARSAPRSVAKDAAENSAMLSGQMHDSLSRRRDAAASGGVPITGRVVSEAGAPLGSASVVLEGTGLVTLTHDDGRYALVVPTSRADGKTRALVARLIGYKPATAPVVAASDSISQDFVLRVNPLALQQLVVTGEGTTSSAEKLGVALASDSEESDRVLSGGDHATLVSRKSSAASNEPVEVSVYQLRGKYITFIDRLRPDTTRVMLDEKSIAPLESTRESSASSIHSITWTDSAGRIRTLRGPVSLELLQQLRRALDAAKP